ncbi:MAG: hypothetical protein ACR2LV_10810 [Solirubrobacteraceae bacterium]
MAVVALPAGAAQASNASIYLKVERSYLNHNATIPACQFTTRQLQDALKEQGAYSDGQYAGGLIVAIQNATNARAIGACRSAGAPAAAAAKAPPAGGSSVGAGSSATGGGTTAGGNPVPLISVTAATNAGLPIPLVLMAVLASLLALVGGSRALARNRGWDHDRARQWRHAWGEAGYRLGGTCGELADRIRRRR